ncbi:MAG: GntR family transcriptional regulator [Burkholderiaceae bacterium]
MPEPTKVRSANTASGRSTKSPPSTPERVAEAITKGLQRREYGVGQRLVEADLTRRLGVGRSTVREALKILASQGVVEIVPHRGAVIRGLSLDDADKLLGVLEVLTGLAARLAATNIDQGGHREKFAAAARPLIEPGEGNDLQQILDQRARFYQAMFDAADSEDLDRAMPTWRAHLFRNQFYGLLTRGDLKAMVAEYRQITAAILAGDAAKAESMARRHLRKSRERMLPHLR